MTLVTTLRLEKVRISSAFTPGEKTYLYHETSVGRFTLSIDAITTRLRGRVSKIMQEISTKRLLPDLRFTIGSSIVFPSNRIDGATTIKCARGYHPRIANRFDLTLECIRRPSRGESSPLASTLQRYTQFFELFVDFSQYFEYFLLDGLWDRRTSRFRFLHHFDDTSTPAVPRTTGELIDYLQANN